LIESTIEELDRQIIAIFANDERAKLLDTIPCIASYTALFLACLII
jgi:hypothetical protein